MLEKFPKLVIDIRCTVLEQDGSVASALINGATMALVDAGIEMNDMISSCTVAVCGATMVMDPSGDEEKMGSAMTTMAIAPVSGRVTYMSCSGGPWEESDFQKAMKMGIVGCAKYDGTMRSLYHESS